MFLIFKLENVRRNLKPPQEYGEPLDATAGC